MKLKVPLPVYYRVYKLLGRGRGRYYALRLVRLLGLRDLLVRMDPNWVCNLKCAMCYFSTTRVFGHDTKSMSIPLFTKIADDVFPRTRLLFFGCGAEPLMSRDFSQYAAIIGRHKVPFVSLLTNGQLLNAENIGSMIESRFNEITISVDGATAQTYESIRVGGRFERLLDNLRLANEMKTRLGRKGLLNLRFTFTAMRRNIAELPLLVELAARHRVASIRVRSLGSWGGALDFANEKLPPAVYQEACHNAQALARSKGIAFLFEGMYEGEPAADGDAGWLRPHACIDPHYKLIIRNDGKMRYCPLLPWEHGDFTRQSYREMEHSPVMRAAGRALARTPQQSCLMVCKGRFPGI